MTGLDVFQECAAADTKIARTREKIERRRALASSCTTRPLSPAGGSSGSGDASMRMLNYVADIEALENDVRRQEAARDAYRGCCLYLAELLPDNLAGVALRYYLEHKGQKVIAAEMDYSQAHIKRLKRNADEELRRIEIIAWDRQHVPLYALH